MQNFAVAYTCIYVLRCNCNTVHTHTQVLIYVHFPQMHAGRFAQATMALRGLLSAVLCVAFATAQRQSSNVARVATEAQLHAAIERGAVYVVITSHMRLTRSVQPVATLKAIVVRAAALCATQIYT